MKSHRPRAGLSLLALALLPGCVLADIAFPPRLRQLAAVAVEPGDLRIEGSPLSNLVTPSVRVTLSVELNLEWFSARYGVPIGPTVSICRDGDVDDDSRLSALGPYNRDTGLEPEDVAPEQRGQRDEHRLYTLFLPVRTDGEGLTRTFGNRPGYRWRDHDLRQEPVDVCIQLRGGNMGVVHFTSNVVRIPAETIRAALARAPRPQ